MIYWPDFQRQKVLQKNEECWKEEEHILLSNHLIFINATNTGKMGQLSDTNSTYFCVFI